MKLIQKIQAQYIKYFLVAFAINLVFRIVETIQVYLKFKPANLLISECFGLMRDIFLIGLILVLFYPLYNLLHKKWPHSGKLLCWFIIGVFVFLHIAISEYFFYQLRPLDIFVFKHRPEEMAFSINTAGLNVLLPAFIKFILILLVYFLLALIAERITISSNWTRRIVFAFSINSILFLSLYFFVKLPVSSNLSVNKSTFIYTNILLDWYKKAFGPDMLKMSFQYQTEFPDKKYISPTYPFLHQFETQNKLSDYLEYCPDTPNLVILIVEGLADDYLHPINGIRFMPYLDSLSQNSLYWDRFFSNSERSFGATPSINGSLPFGNIGFALLDQYPYHFSFVNVLKENQFFTSFYYGQGAWFHGKEPFYKFNNIDLILDKYKYSSKLEKVFIGAENHFWGYNDFDLFKQYFITTDSLQQKQRLDIFFTGTSHAPFALKYPAHYHQKLDFEIHQLKTQEEKDYFEKYRSYYASLYNVDDALKFFMNQFSKRPEFRNTLFIITGDHPMTEIPTDSPLKKYHVPLLIYSPLLKKGLSFHEAATHLDLYETILAYYKLHSNLKVPDYSTALGNGLKFNEVLDNDNYFGLMNDNRQIDEFFYKGYFIANDNTLYKVGPKLELKEVYDIKNWDIIHKKLTCYRAASLNASLYHKLMPDSIYFDFFKYRILAEIKRTEKFTLAENEYSIFEKIKLESNQMFFDLKFQRLEHFNFTPQCVIRIYNKDHKAIHEQVYEFKSNQQACQIHIPISIPTKLENGYFIQAALRNKEKHGFEISELEAKLYSK
ncbi:MAG: sulfatase-like hydrolase/transferase [Saprospiraceae bacterium]|nr:sulfatase-like hydrolase/transferase [Saprospiraceae bacterium]